MKDDTGKTSTMNVKTNTYSVSDLSFERISSQSCYSEEYHLFLQNITPLLQKCKKDTKFSLHLKISSMLRHCVAFLAGIEII